MTEMTANLLAPLIFSLTCFKYHFYTLSHPKMRDMRLTFVGLQTEYVHMVPKDNLEHPVCKLGEK